MNDIYLCVGSACHQQNVYQMRDDLENLLIEYGLNEKVEIKGAFCLGVCLEANVMKVGDELITNVHLENLREKFAKELLPLLTEEATADGE